MEPNPIPDSPDPRLWRRHLIGRQTAAMQHNGRLDPKMARALHLPAVLEAARLRFPGEYSKIAQALGALAS